MYFSTLACVLHCLLASSLQAVLADKRAGHRHLQDESTGDNLREAVHSPACPDGLVDQTFGNAFFWACGVACPGGPYTTNECHCACVSPSAITSTEAPNSTTSTVSSTATTSTTSPPPPLTDPPTTAIVTTLPPPGARDNTPRSLATTSPLAQAAKPQPDDDNSGFGWIEIFGLTAGLTMGCGIFAWLCMAGCSAVSAYIPEQKRKPYIVRAWPRVGSRWSLESWDSTRMGSTKRHRMKRAQVHPDAEQGQQSSNEGTDSWPLPLQLSMTLSGKVGGEMQHSHHLSEASTATSSSGVSRSIYAPPLEHRVPMRVQHVQPGAQSLGVASWPTVVSSATLQAGYNSHGLQAASSISAASGTLSAPPSASLAAMSRSSARAAAASPRILAMSGRSPSPSISRASSPTNSRSSVPSLASATRSSSPHSYRPSPCATAPEEQVRALPHVQVPAVYRSPVAGTPMRVFQ